MTLEEAKKELQLCKNQLDLVPQIRDRYNFLLGCIDVLKNQEEEKSKPDLKAATK